MILKSSMSNRFSKYMPILNVRLISNQNLNQEEVDKIYKLHRVRNCYITLMEISSSKEDLRYLSRIIEQIDFQLQRLWKFDEDSSYHRFWEIPKCDCPKMDNMDVYGTGHRCINPNCKIHGN